MNILLTDHGAADLRGLQALIEAAGHRVLLARDAQDALAMLACETLDAIMVPEISAADLAMFVGDAIESLPFSVAEVVEGACKGLDRLSAQAQVELTFFVDPRIPAWLRGDPLRLRQELLNLVGNAIGCASARGRSGRVSVRVRWIEPQPARPTLEFAVIDKGGGKHAAKAAFESGGIDMERTRRLVEQMGGSIALETAEASDSTVRLRLAFEPSAGDAAPVATTASVVGLHCLVVGDDDSLAPDFALHLRHSGAIVERAGDLAQARARADRLAPAPWIWVIDTAVSDPDLAEIETARTDRPGSQEYFVVVGRGHRRRPRLEPAAWVGLDGNLLSGQDLLLAVAIAAGRAVVEPVDLAESGECGDEDVPMVLANEAQRDAGLMPALAPNSPGAADLIPEVAAPGSAAANAAPAVAGREGIFDLNKLIELVGDEPAAIRDLLEQFQKNAQEGITQMRAIAASSPCRGAGRLAHRLNSAARAVGAGQLAALCEQIERADAQERIEDLWPLFARFESVLTEVLSFVERQLQQEK